MLSEFRVAVAAVCEASPLPAYPTLPDQLNELPCVVVGRPSGTVGDVATTFDVELDVYVIGPNLDAGGSAEYDLDAYADLVLAEFGDTFAVDVDGVGVYVTGIVSAVVDVAGVSFPCYQITVESTARNC